MAMLTSRVCPAHQMGSETENTISHTESHLLARCRDSPAVSASGSRGTPSRCCSPGVGVRGRGTKTGSQQKSAFAMLMRLGRRSIDQPCGKWHLCYTLHLVPQPQLSSRQLHPQLRDAIPALEHRICEEGPHTPSLTKAHQVGQPAITNAHREIGCWLAVCAAPDPASGGGRNDS
jgi:hypothetical protein